MKLTYEKVVTYDVEVSAREFVTKHLREIHKHPLRTGNTIIGWEYDFLISSSGGFLCRQFTLPENLFDMPIEEFYMERSHIGENDNKLTEHIIERLEQIWESIS